MRGAEVETTFIASLCLMTRDQQRSAQTWLPDSSDIELNTDRPHSSAVGPRFARQGSRLGPGNMKSNSGRTRDYLSDYLTQRYRVLQHTVLHCFLLTLVTAHPRRVSSLTGLKQNMWTKVPTDAREDFK